jgi:hypothetical protein
MAAKSGNEAFRDLVQEIGKMPNELRKEIRPMLRRSAQPALAAAKQNASWSSRIPGATRISVGFSKRTPGVALVVNKNKAPHARAYEHGGKDGKFRSPVFGNRDNWVSHTARPFLWRAAEPWMNRVDADVGEVVDKVSRDLGFK